MILEKFGLKRSEKKIAAKTDVDSPASRLKRAMNFYDFESEVLLSTFNKDFASRFILTRKAMFQGFPDIDGENYQELLNSGKLVSPDRPVIDDEFLPLTEVVEEAFPVYMRFMDQQFDTLQSMEKTADYQDKVFRFLAVLYILGVIIHPVRDGNGQTFKGMVLSYLHELLPNYRDRFIPIKTEANIASTKEMALPRFMGGGMYVSIDEDLIGDDVPKLSGEEIEYWQTVRKNIFALRKQIEATSSAQEKATYRKQLAELLAQLARDSHEPIPQREKIVGYLPTAKKMFSRPTPVYSDIGTDFTNWLSDYLTKKGYPIESARSLFSWRANKSERSTHVMRQILLTDEGLNVLTQFINSGEVKLQEESQNARIFSKLLRILTEQKKQIILVLESKEEHQRRKAELEEQL